MGHYQICQIGLLSTQKPFLAFRFQKHLYFVIHGFTNIVFQTIPAKRTQVLILVQFATSYRGALTLFMGQKGHPLANYLEINRARFLNNEDTFLADDSMITNLMG